VFPHGRWKEFAWGDVKRSVQSALALDAVANLKREWAPDPAEHDGRRPYGFSLYTGMGKTWASWRLIMARLNRLRDRPDNPPLHIVLETLAVGPGDEYLPVSFSAMAKTEAMTWRQALQFIGKAVGLSRADARNIRALLMALACLHGATFVRCAARLHARGARVRAFPHKALTGSTTRNAPPAALSVRQPRRTGSLSAPPMPVIA
jgi:hypothetical protein